MSTPPKPANEIASFFHCAKCFHARPSHLSPREWMRLECGWTPRGFQVWCVRHDINVMDIDLLGQKVQATSSRKSYAEIVRDRLVAFVQADGMVSLTLDDLVDVVTLGDLDHVARSEVDEDAGRPS